MPPSHNTPGDGTKHVDTKTMVQVTDAESIKDAQKRAVGKDDEERKKKRDQRGETILASMCVTM